MLEIQGIYVYPFLIRELIKEQETAWLFKDQLLFHLHYCDKTIFYLLI